MADAADYADRKAQVLAKLEARKQEREKGKSEASNKAQNGAGGSDFDFFSTKFQTSVKDIRGKIEESEKQEKCSTDEIDKIAKEIGGLSKFLGESTPYLSAYESKKAQNTLSELQETFQAFQQKFRPKKRFEFKSKPKSSAKVKKPEEKQAANEEVKVKKTVSEIAAVEVTVCGKSNETVVLEDLECESKDILLSDLTACKIILRGSPNTLHLTRLNDCKIQATPCRTSIFLEGCQKSTFHIACQQLRMHTSTDCDVYLHVSTRGIIEDCSEVRFAPLELNESHQKKMKEIGLDSSKNNWNKIEDFNWLNPETPSPHWSILPESKRKQFDD